MPIGTLEFPTGLPDNSTWEKNIYHFPIGKKEFPTASPDIFTWKKCLPFSDGLTGYFYLGKTYLPFNSIQLDRLEL